MGKYIFQLVITILNCRKLNLHIILTVDQKFIFGKEMSYFTFVFFLKSYLYLKLKIKIIIIKLHTKDFQT